MAGDILTLADAMKKVSVMSTAPADMAAPTVTELTAGIDAAPRIVKSDFALGPTGSDTVDEVPLATKGNGKAWGPSNYEGSMSVFRYFDPSTGAPETGGAGTVGDALFQAVKTKGTTLWIAVRETSKDSTDPWLASDEVQVYEVMTDDPQNDDGTGYIKKVVKLSVLSAELDGLVAAGA